MVPELPVETAGPISGPPQPLGQGLHQGQDLASGFWPEMRLPGATGPAFPLHDQHLRDMEPSPPTPSPGPLAGHHLPGRHSASALAANKDPSYWSFLRTATYLEMCAPGWEHEGWLFRGCGEGLGGQGVVRPSADESLLRKGLQGDGHLKIHLHTDGHDLLTSQSVATPGLTNQNPGLWDVNLLMECLDIMWRARLLGQVPRFGVF